MNSTYICIFVYFLVKVNNVIPRGYCTCLSVAPRIITLGISKKKKKKKKRERAQFTQAQVRKMEFIIKVITNSMCVS